MVAIFLGHNVLKIEGFCEFVIPLRHIYKYA